MFVNHHGLLNINSYEVDQEEEGDKNGRNSNLVVVDIYPLSNYYFTSKQPHISSFVKDQESLADRALRLKSNYEIHGMRTCVEAVILVELFKHPHLLLLQTRNYVYKLPGGRLRPGESDVNGMKRKLLSKLSADDDSHRTEWKVGECIGTWWRSDCETLPFPYLPASGKSPKECIKLYLVKLPLSREFVVPKNFKLLVVPMCQLHESSETYGSVIAGIPQLLSRFSINMINT
uniref:pre-mRNA cleavage factor Im 25 kDa subunit 1 n=1 Tax=Erigeron canadensis TaxID=72917 RepID=UPI001CB8B09F|nr:pre-mRNA cleavage factor Im 25 kDa subunit 1 [Erigeron canadensis]